MSFGELRSMDYFEGFGSAAEVRAHDDPILSRIGGSYEAIANRYRQFINGDYNKKLYSVDFRGTVQPGSAPCPVGCNILWSDDWAVHNLLDGSVHLFNHGLIHMAEEHHLLEKGEWNIYAINDPEEFYEKFMKD